MAMDQFRTTFFDKNSFISKILKIVTAIFVLNIFATFIQTKCLGGLVFSFGCQVNTELELVARPRLQMSLPTLVNGDHFENVLEGQKLITKVFDFLAEPLK